MSVIVKFTINDILIPLDCGFTASSDYKTFEFEIWFLVYKISLGFRLKMFEHIIAVFLHIEY